MRKDDGRIENSPLPTPKERSPTALPAPSSGSSSSPFVATVSGMTSETTKTEVGSYFISNYPPYSTWKKELVDEA